MEREFEEQRVWPIDIFISGVLSIVCIQKKIPVQSAIEYVFVMIESAIRRWFDVRAQIPNFDPHTDEIVSKYIEEIECSNR